jgi:hypothetical protein
VVLATLGLAVASSACSATLEDPRRGVVLRPSTLRSSEPTLGERFAECGRGRAAGQARERCSGAEVFFFEPLPLLARGCRAALPAR